MSGGRHRRYRSRSRPIGRSIRGASPRLPPCRSPRPTLAPVAPDTFRAVMGHFVTGMHVVTALDGDQPQGITVNALTSVSLEPPLVVVALDRRRFITPTVHASGRYAVSVLSEDQQALSDCFRPRRGDAGPRRVLRRPVDPRPDRAAAHRRRDRRARMHGRRDIRGRRPRAVRRPGRLARQRGAPRDAAALLPPPPEDPAGRVAAARGRAGPRHGRCRPEPTGRPEPACRRSPRTGSRSRTRTIAGRRWSCSWRDVDRAARTSPPRSRAREGSADTCPTPVATASTLGCRRGFLHDWLVDDLAAFADALGLETFHLLGFSMGGDDRAPVRGGVAGAVRTLVVVGISTQREPRASVARRLMDPRRADVDDPPGAPSLPAPRRGPGLGAWRTLLPAIAADVASQPLLTPGGLRPSTRRR